MAGLAIAIALAAAIVFALDRPSGTPMDVLTVERLLATGRQDQARREIDRATNLDAAWRDYLEGLCLVAQGRDADALPALERAAAARPADWRIVSTLVSAAANAGRLDRAREALDAYLARSPDDERALAASARVLLDGRSSSQDPGAALERLDRIASLKERVATGDDVTAIRDDDVLRMRVRAQLALGRGPAALGDAQALAAMQPKSPEAWLLVGDAARASPSVPGAPKESVEAYGKAFGLAPDDRRIGEQYVKALILFKGDPKEMLRVTETLLARAPDAPELLILRAKALVRADRIDEANDVYADLLERPLSKDLRMEVLRNRGVLLFDWKQGGRRGEYLEDAYLLLDEYVREGGKLDDPNLENAWKTLVESHAPK